MWKRVMSFVLAFALSVCATSTVYAAEEIAVETAEEAIAEASEPAPAPEPEPSAPEAVAEAVEASESASESIEEAHEIFVSEFDLSETVLPYLDEAAVYVDGGSLPSTPETPVVAQTPAVTAPVADAASPATEAPAQAEAPATTEKTTKGVTGDLKAAQAILEETPEVDTAAVEEAIAKTQENLDTFEEAVTEGTAGAEEAIGSAKAAGEAGTKEEAEEAQRNAGNRLAVAEEKLAEATDAYDEARVNAKEAQDAYDEAVAQREEAIAKIEEAQKNLESAKTNSAAAKEALEKAQEAAIAADERVRELRESKDELTAIRDQYYASMVYYYRNLLGKDAVFQDDGHLDLLANAEAVQASGKAEKEALNAGKTGIQLNRYLATMLIDYLISHNDNVDPETANIQIGAYEKGATLQTAQQGTVFTNAKGEDQTVYTGTKKDINGNVVAAGEKKDLYITQSKQGDNGRTNRILVTYTDKDGQEHQEYYNYIYKSKKYEDGTDIENGPIYLALVRYDEETGFWASSGVQDENNFDDYEKLSKALDAINDLERYEQARQAVEEAAERVSQLEEMIDSLKIENPESLDQLEEALTQAKEELEAAEQKKADLEAIVEEAREAVEGIDLSRFDVRFAQEVPEEMAEEYEEAAKEAAVADLVAGRDTGYAFRGVTSSPLPTVEELESSPANALPTIPVVLTPLSVRITPDTLNGESPLRGVSPSRTASNSSPLAARFAMIPEALTPVTEEEEVDLETEMLGEAELPGAGMQGTEQKSRKWWVWLLAAIATVTGWGFLKKKVEQIESGDLHA